MKFSTFACFTSEQNNATVRTKDRSNNRLAPKNRPIPGNRRQGRWEQVFIGKQFWKSVPYLQPTLEEVLASFLCIIVSGSRPDYDLIRARRLFGVRDIESMIMANIDI
ncbi:hypothetical protein I7I51_05593 [Histoplasma capsulatum]|uniref:Uncharacterized protein n=1 Tax=Ajellomyces capsulatus TaxID=5037 RepID=A0A8A1M669_AJECA|nr:hypothetical protein I7I51_05593 [Histoplasma capsulatum]